MNSLAARHLFASSQAQALNALVFLYNEVLQYHFEWLTNLARPKRSQRLPSILSRDQVRRILARLTGRELLMSQLVYGTGIRIGECIALRSKTFNGRKAQSKSTAEGGKDRVALLPRGLVPSLRHHVIDLARRHAVERLAGQEYAAMPDVLATKFPRAAMSFSWQYLFGSAIRSFIRPGIDGSGCMLHRPAFSVPSALRVVQSVRCRMYPCTLCATASQCLFFRLGQTSAPFRRCSATPTSKQR